MPSASLREIIAKANKRYGEDTLVLGEDLANKEFVRCSTGSLSFDAMLGGGWPLNTWNEIVGMESNGKTVLVLKTIAANMAADPSYECLWVASEDFVPDWAEKLGVDLTRLVVVDTQIMEEAYQIIIDALDARAIDAVVVDSLPALVPSEENEKLMEEWAVGLGARLTGKFMRKSGKAQKRSLTKADDRPCLGLIINQWREKIGVMYGDPRTTPGGKAKNFSYFTRVEVVRDEWINGANKEPVGLTIKARTLKNKSFPPKKLGSVDFYFDDYQGFRVGDFDTVKEVFTLGVASDVITRAGAFYSYNGNRWQGKEAAVASIREEVDLYAALREEVLKALTTL